MIIHDDVLNRDYEVFLEDDGTLDTVISVNGATFRFSDVPRNEHGLVSMDTFRQMADEAIEAYEEGLESDGEVTR